MGIDQIQNNESNGQVSPTNNSLPNKILDTLSEEQIDEMDEILSECLKRIDEPIVRGSIIEFYKLDIEGTTRLELKNKLYKSTYDDLQGLSGLMYVKERALPYMKKSLSHFLFRKNTDGSQILTHIANFLEQYNDINYIRSHSLFEQILSVEKIYHHFIETYNQECEKYKINDTTKIPESISSIESSSGGSIYNTSPSLDYYDNKRDRYNYDNMAKNELYFTSWNEDFQSLYEYKRNH